MFHYTPKYVNTFYNFFGQLLAFIVVVSDVDDGSFSKLFNENLRNNY